MKLSPSTVTLSKPGPYPFKAENKGSAEHSLEIDGKGVRSKGSEVGEAKLEQPDPGQAACSGDFAGRHLEMSGHRPQTGGHEGEVVSSTEARCGAGSRARSSS